MKVGLGQYGAILLLVHLLHACSPSAPDAANRADRVANAADNAGRAPAQGETRLVVAFGDSRYAGYNLAPGEGFAPMLERALKDKGIAAQVVDAGVSGDTTTGGRGRLAFVLDGLARKPDLLILGLGGNDMLRGLSPATTRDNLDAMLAELKARGIPAMLTGLVAPPNLDRPYAAQFDGIYTDLARQYDVPLYPFFLEGVFGQRELMLSDGIHPSAQGVARVVERIEPMVAQALGE